MEEELNYTTATFKSNGASAYKKQEDTFVIYDQVNIDHENIPSPENLLKRKAEVRFHPLLCLLAAALATACVILVSAIIILSNHLSTVKSEKEREIKNFTTQFLQLDRKMEELARERDRLNWTLGVILQYDMFLVSLHCPRKVCTPCQDGWTQFKTNCYLFEESSYYYNWRGWDGSRSRCKEMMADLVVIESPEEQEFISNHTKAYNDALHGYWMGLSNRNTNNMWMWIDGRNSTVEYWKKQQPGYKVSCALTLPSAHPLANWGKASCDMRNRWICETKALIKYD